MATWQTKKNAPLREGNGALWQPVGRLYGSGHQHHTPAPSTTEGCADDVERI